MKISKLTTRQTYVWQFQQVSTQITDALKELSFKVNYSCLVTQYFYKNIGYFINPQKLCNSTIITIYNNSFAFRSVLKKYSLVKNQQLFSTHLPE